MFYDKEIGRCPQDKMKTTLHSFFAKTKTPIEFVGLSSNEHFIRYKVVEGATSEQVKSHLEQVFGDRHWTWMRVGSIISVGRKPCAPHICDCTECECCGKMECGLDDGLCEDCISDGE